MLLRFLIAILVLAAAPLAGAKEVVCTGSDLVAEMQAEAPDKASAMHEKA